MFIMRNALPLFISLAIGYVLCVLANKQKDLLKTVGFTLGISVIVFSLIYSVMDTCGMMCMKGKYRHGGKAMKCPAGMFMKGNIK